VICKPWSDLSTLPFGCRETAEAVDLNKSNGSYNNP
jgi:hypothetical protein